MPQNQTPKVIENFTCPACGKILEKVVLRKGKVMIWCGIAQTPVVVDIRKGGNYAWKS